MKIYLLFASFCLLTVIASAQNQLRISGGVLSTSTTVSEYSRGLDYFFYDSVFLDTRVTRPAVNIDVDIDLGKHFFFTTGLSYSTKGITSINYTKVAYWYGAQQEYIGLKINLKYHHKFSDGKFGIFAAAGGKADFTVGGPTSAEIAILDGAQYFQAFGTFKPVDFSLLTNFGISYRLGPGDIILDISFQNGLTDVLEDQFIVGRSFSMGAGIGYSLYLEDLIP
jgi:hypothetical protein